LLKAQPLKIFRVEDDKHTSKFNIDAHESSSFISSLSQGRLCSRFGKEKRCPPLLT
jgi:hypothetical protein